LRTAQHLDAFDVQQVKQRAVWPREQDIVDVDTDCAFLGDKTRRSAAYATNGEVCDRAALCRRAAYADIGNEGIEAAETVGALRDQLIAINSDNRQRR
jgi:hypothetical protein